MADKTCAPKPAMALALGPKYYEIL